MVRCYNLTYIIEMQTLMVYAGWLLFHNSYHISHAMYCDTGGYCVSYRAVLPVCIAIHQSSESTGVSFQSNQIVCCI